MSTMTSLPQSRPYTRADLAAMVEERPDDGHRWELIDGVLVVSPAPRHLHQRAVGRLHLLLHAACPEGLEVLLAPFSVVLAEDTEMQPDLLVARLEDFTEKDLPVAPLLAVEVLSPSTRHFDLSLKRARFEVAGVAAYWVVDPDADTPSLLAWELRDGAFVEVGRVSGDESWTGHVPYDVTVVPSALVR